MTAKLDPTFGSWLGPVDLSDFKIEDKGDLIALLNQLVRGHVSDIFMQTGKPVLLSYHGKMVGKTHPLKKSNLENIMRWMVNQESVVARLQSGNDFDAAFSVEDPEVTDDSGYPVKNRFRVNLTSNIYEGDVGYQVCLRYIEPKPPSFDDVGLEPEIIPHLDSGMGSVMFVGETGSGKTSTIAASIVNVLRGNTSISGNVITYESPVEFVFEDIPSSCCVISQHEIGTHLPSFAAGVRNSLRRKPGLIMIGELRDSETISAAVEAANNGHPIYTTTHANSTDLAFKRLFEKYPTSHQSQAFHSILATTNLIVAQRLVPRADGEGMICLREWVALDTEVRRLLEEAGPEKYDRVLRRLLDSEELGDHGRSIKTTVKMRWRAKQIDDETALRVLRNFGYQKVTLGDLE